MSEKKMDMAKVLAMLAQPQETPAPLTGVERIRLEIPYITKENKVEVRTVRVVLPEAASKPMPLIYIPHYEMGEDSLELRDYLAQRWAVACPDAFDNNYNGKLTDDDLVFDNAALYALRNRPEFDKDRIILVGGSAGGYMTMMLNGLQLGLCASVANGPITNAYFNFYHYFNKANGLNLKALAEMAAKKAMEGLGANVQNGKAAAEGACAQARKNEAESYAGQDDKTETEGTGSRFTGRRMALLLQNRRRNGGNALSGSMGKAAGATRRILLWYIRTEFGKIPWTILKYRSWRKAS